MINVTTSDDLEYKESVVDSLQLESFRAQTEANKIFTLDATIKIWLRIILCSLFLMFLFLQNYFVYWLVYQTVFFEIEGLEIADMETLLPLLVGGTIAQTISIVAIIVKWVFSDIDYKNHPQNHHD